jgi:light-regulated signal transduction histidine kinase (bacteriophytochrome)
VCTYSEILQQKYGGKLDPGANEYIGYIVAGAQRMEELLTDLRVLMRTSTMNRQTTHDVDANECFTRALATLRPAIERSGALITHGPLPSVHMHAIQLEQLFQNLLSNALRYRSEEPPRIHVAAERSGAEWKFSVRDNGIGIDPQYKEYIFGIFKRLHTPAEYAGTGMGLAICRRIVERAGGRIWVESAPGRGATFFFTLPARKNQ